MFSPLLVNAHGADVVAGLFHLCAVLFQLLADGTDFLIVCVRQREAAPAQGNDVPRLTRSRVDAQTAMDNATITVAP